MADQIQIFINVIKTQLKARGLTYQDVARHLKVSEVTVKRLFTSQDISLKRVEAIGEMLNLTILELASLANKLTDTKITTLSLNQEKTLAEDPTLLVYFYLVINGWQAQEIEKKYNINRFNSINLLAKLDKLNLIELLPNNEIHLLTHRNIRWIANGPVRRLHELRAKSEFMNEKFDEEHAGFNFVFGELSAASREIIARKMEKLIKEFNELADIDANLPETSKSSTGLMTATRPWVFSIVDAFKSQPLK